MIASGKADYSVAVNGLGQNGYGAGYPGEYSLMSALVFKVVMTFLFVTVILGATQNGAPGAMAGLAIGPALFVSGKALADLLGLHRGPAGGWRDRGHRRCGRSDARRLTDSAEGRHGGGATALPLCKYSRATRVAVLWNHSKMRHCGTG